MRGEAVRASAGSVLVTGGSGFIASALIPALAQRWNVRVSTRRRAGTPNEHCVGEMGAGADWSEALEGAATVVHLAGPSNSYFPADVIQRGIVGGTEELVAQARPAGVSRFLFVSSMKACADRSAGAPLREGDEPPQGSVPRERGLVRALQHQFELWISRF